tara:strand:- start:265 stop:819 length:555 start_codon:yes stop_codon:yes gene_type:complete
MKRINIKKFLSIALVALSISHGGFLYAQNTDAVDLDQLKVAFVFNFSKYFTWPENGKWSDIENFNICVNDSKASNAYFTALAGEISQGKTIDIIDISEGSIDIGKTCHIWFIDQASFSKNRARLEALGSSDVLTVSDYPGFYLAGGIMEFVRVGNRMKFRINSQAAEDKRLSVSSFLMTLAMKN